MDAVQRRRAGTSHIVSLHSDDGAFDDQFWASVPPAARLEALWDLTLEWRTLQGFDGDQPRLQRSVCVVERRGR